MFLMSFYIRKIIKTYDKIFYFIMSLYYLESYGLISISVPLRVPLTKPTMTLDNVIHFLVFQRPKNIPHVHS